MEEAENWGSNSGSVGRERNNGGKEEGRERGRIKKSLGADLWAHYSHFPENGTHPSLPVSLQPQGQGGEGRPFPRVDKNTQSTSAAPISSGTVSGVFWFPAISVAFLHIVRYICVLVHRGDQRGNVGYLHSRANTPWFCSVREGLSLTWGSYSRLG